MPRDEEQQHKNLLRGVMAVSRIGINMASCVLIGIFIGQFLDRRFGASPWFLLFFSLLGVAVSFKVLIDFAKKM